MRNLLVLILSLYINTIFAQTIHQKVLNALSSINQGYVQYGIDELRKAATVNSVAAQFFLAVCLEEGSIIEQDTKEAFNLYRKTAERGLPDAMYHLAFFYRNGIVVPQNNARYNEWMQRFNKKGGKFTLPDINPILKEGLKHPENYALSPTPSAPDDNRNLLAINNGNVNSNNQVINQITIVQQATDQVPAPSTQPEKELDQKKSDVDENIPSNPQANENTFALIIANENYQDVAPVPNAINDGSVVAEYCEKALGLPKSNIHFIKDATLNNIKREINLMKQIAEAYNGTGKIIVYYAGHGIPEESSKNAYLLPIDGYGSDVSTCYSLDDLYNNLGKMPATQIVVFLDACFSGSLRGDGMLASARGVAIKAKSGVPTGNLVVLSATQGDETAYSYDEQGHGLFTYYLLKKLKETNGDTSIGELSAYIKENVIKKSLVVNGKQQTPSTSSSASIANEWINWKLK